MIALNVIWSLLPFAMLIILAGLQGVPTEIIEAAKIDGASTLQKHLHVIIPSIRGVLGFATLICIMDVVRIFDQLIPLAPQAIPIGNESIMLYIYNDGLPGGQPEPRAGQRGQRATIILILIMLFPFIRGVFQEAKAR